MASSRFFETAHQYIPGSIKKKDFVIKPHLLQSVQSFKEAVEQLSPPDIANQGDTVDFTGRLDAQLCKFGDEGRGEVVHGKITQVLKTMQSAALTCPGKAGN